MGLVSSIYSGESAPAPKGRKEKDGQERPLQPQVLKDRAKELIVLATLLDTARRRFSDAIKATAEASGFNTRAIRGMVNARYAGNDAVTRAQRDAEQLSIAINETSDLDEQGELPTQ
jgi:hypothetical protein